MSGSDNPFAALVEDAPNELERTADRTGEIIESIFGLTLSEETSRNRGYVLLKEVAQAFSSPQLNLEALEHALFERLFLQNPADFVLCDKKKISGVVVEAEVITYLYSCYNNVAETNDLEDDVKIKVKGLILRNAVTALKQPDLYEGQKIFEQLLNVLKTFSSENFFIDLYKEFLKEEGLFYVYVS